MKRFSIALLGGLLSALSLLAQSPNTHSARLSGSSIPPKFGGVPPSEIPEHAEFDVWVEQIPKQYIEGIGSGFVNQPNDFAGAPVERFVSDHIHKIYMHYLVKIERDAQPYRYRLSFSRAQSPLPPDIARDREWKLVDPAVLPVPQIVENKEPLSIELYSNPPSTRRVVDVIRVGVGLFQARTEGGRDVFADDAEMVLQTPKLKVNGVPARFPNPEQLQGKSIQVTIPSYGTYTLALRPLNANMKLVGEIEGKRLTFMIGGNVIRLDCADSVANGSAIFNVYGEPSAR